MRALRSAIHRHITSPPYNRTINIMHGVQFQSANQVMDGQLKLLRVVGKDKSSHKPAIHSEDIKRMYNTNTLSKNNPESLLNKVFFEVMLHFGRRGCEGLRTLEKGDIEIKCDAHGKKFATVAYNVSEKNHPGINPHETTHQQIMYACENKDQCPVESLELYLSKLHQDCTAFFQRPRVKPWKCTDPVWYCNAPVGKNSIAKMMPNISTKANLSRKYTNHSIRATCVTALK